MAAFRVLRIVIVLIFTLSQAHGFIGEANIVANDTSEILKIAERAYFLYNKNSDSSLYLAKKAKALSETIHYSKGLGRAIRVIGIYYWSKGDYDTALAQFENALSQSLLANDQRGIADCYRNIAVVYRSRGIHSKALEYNFNALKIYEKINDVRGLANLYNNVGLIYKEHYQFDKAFEYLNQAIKFQKQIGDTAGIARAYGNIGIIYAEQLKWKEALPNQLLALELNEKAKDLRGISLAASNLGDIYVGLQQPEIALPHLERGLRVAIEGGFQDLIANAQATLAKYYNSTHQYEDGLKYADMAQTIASRIGNTKIAADAYLEKYVAAAALSKPANALEAYKTYILLRDSIKNLENNQRGLMMEYTFKEEKARIEKEKMELEYLAKNERQTRILNTFGGLSFTLIVLSVLIFLNNKKIRAKKVLLVKQQNELEIQNQELVNSKEEIAAQRDILAAQNQELKEARAIIEKQHHEIKVRNERLEDDVRERTKELSDYNEQLEQFAFISAHNLRAPVARILGLGELLKHKPEGKDEKIIAEKMVDTAYEIDEVVRHLNMILYIRNDNTISITPIHVEEELKLLKRKLDSAIRQACVKFEEDFSQAPVIFTMKPYFENILYTLLDNAIKYRQENTTLVIKIKTESENNYYTLTVEDNGLGIDLSVFQHKLFTLYSRFHFHVEGKGIGLYLLKTQVTALKGKIEVESKVNVGTTFKVFFPAPATSA